MLLEPTDVQRDLSLAVRAGLDGLAVAAGPPDPEGVHRFLAGLDLFEPLLHVVVLAFCAIVVLVIFAFGVARPRSR